jgi:hypothetical protein
VSVSAADGTFVIEALERGGDLVVCLLEELVLVAREECVVAIAHGRAAQIAERVVHRVARDRAVRDRDQLVRAVREKSRSAVHHMHADAVAVRVWLGRRDDRAHRDFGKFSDAPQRLLDLPLFQLELLRIGDVLVRAAAAAGEVFAFRLRTVGRRRDDRDE